MQHPPPAPTMNRRRVIILVTVGMFVILTFLATAFFGRIPPWPMLLWFAVSHIFFCVVIAKVRPFHGPHTEPMADPDLSSWPK